ncbi:zinc ribbon domain-containing protein [Aneurinibacillus migulanus]|uniref:zinc ribbon domain-containing protein n=1 Tax=Aneurinibacillus migulanus TaxID=47500 RepID=UPI002E23E0A7|nr:zinc ribbon domain-containing protein [Aneurinibacillus migulanus]
MKSKRSIQPKKIHPGTYPLSGLLKCPQCGSVMVQGNSSQKYKYYQCNKNKSSGKSACSSNLIKKNYAEEYVLEAVLSQINTLNLSPLLQAITISNLNSNLVSLEDEVKILKKALEKVEKKIIDLYKLFNAEDEDERISTETFTLLVKEAEKEKKRDQQRLNELNERIALQKDLNLSQNINFVVDDFISFYQLISDEDKKLLFHNLIKEIHITKGSTTKERKIKEIIYHFLPENMNTLLSA